MDIYQLFEDFGDGVLILSKQGQPVFSNAHARRICQAIAQNARLKGILPRPLWQICQKITGCCEEAIAPESIGPCDGEFLLGKTNRLRIRTHPIKFDGIDQPCLMLIFEDRHQVIQFATNADAHHYSLTPREKEVWALRRAGHSYGDIANQLYITVDTVKKHLKNIRIKRDNSQHDNSFSS